METKQAAQKKLVPAALFLAVVSISFAAIFFRQAAPTHPLVSAGIRLAVAAIVLLPWTIRALRKARSQARLLLSATLAGLLYGVHFGSWVSSLMLTSVPASVTLVTTTPLLLALLALITGRDRPDRRVWLALLLAFVGLLFIGGTDFALGPEALAGDGLALLGAMGMVGYLIVARRLGEDLDLWAFSGIATGVGAISLLATAALAGIPLQPASTEAFVYLVLAAIVPQLIGHNLLTWSLRYTRPVVVGMAVVGEPVGATILSVLWLGDSISVLVIIGCVITISAVILAIVRSRAAQVAV